MVETLVLAFTFLAGFLGIFGINLIITDLFEQDRQEEVKRQQELHRIRQREMVRERLKADQLAGKLTQSASLSKLAAAAQDELQDEQRSPMQRFSEWVEQSGTRWTTAKLIRVVTVWGLGIGLLFGLASRSILPALIAGSIAGSVPMLFITWHRRRRMAKLVSQLPDALELMSRIIRSGQTITQAMQSVSLESAAPLSTEFGYCYEQTEPRAADGSGIKGSVSADRCFGSENLRSGDSSAPHFRWKSSRIVGQPGKNCPCPFHASRQTTCTHGRRTTAGDHAACFATGRLCLDARGQQRLRHETSRTSSPDHGHVVLDGNGRLFH